MIDRVAAKEAAKSQLKGNWGTTIGAFIVINLISGATGIVQGFIPFLGLILTISLTGAVTLGMAMFSLTYTKGEVPGFERIFDGFTHFVQSLKAIWWLELWVFLWSLPMSIAIGVMMTSMFVAIQSTSTVAAGAFFALFVLVMVLSIVVIVKSISYSMLFYIIADDPEGSVREALTESKKITQGHKWQLFVVSLSFLGWGLLAVLTLGIGFLWLTPYINVTLANVYQQIKTPKEEPIAIEETVE